MKIIGKTENGYLVETTENEIAQAFGFDWSSDRDFIEATRRARSNNAGNSLMIGAEIQIGEAHRYLAQLRDKELAVRTAGKTLRELSELMLAGVPTAVAPPKQPAGSRGDA